MREAVIKACLHAFTTCVRSGWPVDAGQPGSGGVTKSNRSTRARRLPDNQNQGVPNSVPAIGGLPPSQPNESGTAIPADSAPLANRNQDSPARPNSLVSPLQPVTPGAAATIKESAEHTAPQLPDPARSQPVVSVVASEEAHDSAGAAHKYTRRNLPPAQSGENGLEKGPAAQVGDSPHKPAAAPQKAVHEVQAETNSLSNLEKSDPVFQELSNNMIKMHIEASEAENRKHQQPYHNGQPDPQPFPAAGLARATIDRPGSPMDPEARGKYQVWEDLQAQDEQLAQIRHELAKTNPYLRDSPPQFPPLHPRMQAEGPHPLAPPRMLAIQKESTYNNQYPPPPPPHFAPPVPPPFGPPPGYDDRPRPEGSKLFSDSSKNRPPIHPGALAMLPVWMRKLATINLEREDNLYTPEELNLKRAIYLAARAQEL